ncbi:MAG: hypothetical protein A2017_13470 [Lentisphaerae bacterium GWF2_44_16]|nr:MAG: hypothetical protein A2017_13470 [Lentisphaerae bacterium GWF2_44_16]
MDTFSLKKVMAFTLLELLIVITIIVILTALLLPALKSARETSKSISCLSNIKQLGLGLNSYADDYSGYFPDKPTSSDCFLSWDAKIAAYFNLDGTKFVPNSKSTVYLCPSMQINYAYSGRSFAANNNLGENRGLDVDIKRLPQILYPSILAGLFETPNCSGSFFGPRQRNMYIENETINNKQEFRHRNGENLLFFDGHAEWKSYAWVDSRAWTGLYYRTLK